VQAPRLPQESDHAKRKQELEAAHAGDAPPAMTPEEVREAELTFAHF